MQYTYSFGNFTACTIDAPYTSTHLPRGRTSVTSISTLIKYNIPKLPVYFYRFGP